MPVCHNCPIQSSLFSNGWMILPCSGTRWLVFLCNANLPKLAKVGSKFCPILNNPAENLPKTYKIAKVGSKCRPILNNPATKDLKKAKAAKFRQIWLHCWLGISDGNIKKLSSGVTFRWLGRCPTGKSPTGKSPKICSNRTNLNHPIPPTYLVLIHFNGNS